MKNPWDRGSFSKEEFEEAVDKTAQIPGLNRGAAYSELQHLTQMSIPLEEAVQLLFGRNDATHLLSESYDSFEDWDGDLPPPKVDDWVSFSEDDGKSALSSAASDLRKEPKYSVYCLEFTYRQRSLQQLQREMKAELFEMPSGVREAWSADLCLYVGYTTQLWDRLRTHGVGLPSDDTPPARITAVADVVGAGVVAATEDKDHALDVEEKYAENLRSAGPEGVFVYQS